MKKVEEKVCPKCGYDSIYTEYQLNDNTLLSTCNWCKYWWSEASLEEEEK